MEGRRHSKTSVHRTTNTCNIANHYKKHLRRKFICTKKKLNRKLCNNANNAKRNHVSFYGKTAAITYFHDSWTFCDQISTDSFSQSAHVIRKNWKCDRIAECLKASCEHIFDRTSESHREMLSVQRLIQRFKVIPKCSMKFDTVEYLLRKLRIYWNALKPFR